MGRGGGGGGGRGKSGVGGGGTIEKLDKAFDASPGAANNLVSLDKFRENLGGTREQQDAMIHEGRIAGKFTLETHEGLLRPPTAAQKAAAIKGVEGQKDFVYIARK